MNKTSKPTLLRDGLLLLCSVALSIPSTLIVNHLISPTPLISSFDLKSAVQNYAKHLAQEDLSESEIADKSAKFSLELEQTLARYSRDNHALILVQGAVIQGALPIDDAINQAVQNQMQQRYKGNF
ncbi:TrbI F-type domain-containing protein [Photobacterium damselae]|uniref:TrbI F-type domain-containing protein n=1 Tax=Photobacterium damselae TaxID=38293 RepID=UPI0040694D74